MDHPNSYDHKPLKLTKADSIAIVKKMLDDKNAISSYLKGDIALEELHSKGIKFVKAL